jgi:hypothetical protein
VIVGARDCGRLGVNNGDYLGVGGGVARTVGNGPGNGGAAQRERSGSVVVNAGNRTVVVSQSGAKIRDGGVAITGVGGNIEHVSGRRDCGRLGVNNGDYLGVGGGVARTVGNGPGNGGAAQRERSGSVVVNAGNRTVVVSQSGAKIRDGGVAITGVGGNIEHVSGRRDCGRLGVNNGDYLGVGGGVARTVGNGPGNGGAAQRERSGSVVVNAGNRTVGQSERRQDQRWWRSNNRRRRQH